MTSGAQTVVRFGCEHQPFPAHISQSLGGADERVFHSVQFAVPGLDKDANKSIACIFATAQIVGDELGFRSGFDEFALVLDERQRTPPSRGLPALEGNYIPGTGISQATNLRVLDGVNHEFSLSAVQHMAGAQ